MFLEPIYLNEVMLMNCASYLFKGVSLKAETVSTTENTKGIEGQVDGNTEGGLNFLSNIAKISGGLSLQGSNNNLQNYQNTMERTITLGSLHMEVINTLNNEGLKIVDNSFLNKKPSTYDYVRVKAILKPIDFYTVLEILKLILPQLEKFFDLAGETVFKPQKGKNQNKKLIEEKVDKYKGIAKALGELIKELKDDYLSSNQLEMIMTDEEGNQLGVLDIDVKDKEPSEIKAQLTDGEFIIFGKIVRYVDEDSELSLTQRSSLSVITDKLNKIVSVISLFTTKDSDSPENQEQDVDITEQWTNLTSLGETILNEYELLELKMKGPVIRLKAMSVCM